MRKTRVVQSYLRLKCAGKLNPGLGNFRQPSLAFSMGDFRAHSAIESPKYANTQFVDGVIKSNYDDIRPLKSDETIDKFVWKDLDKWPNHVAIVSNFEKIYLQNLGTLRENSFLIG